jgi:hypothetical protein
MNHPHPERAPACTTEPTRQDRRAQLRTKGYRLTPQRELVLDAVQRLGRLLGRQDVELQAGSDRRRHRHAPTLRPQHGLPVGSACQLVVASLHLQAIDRYGRCMQPMFGVDATAGRITEQVRVGLRHERAGRSGEIGQATLYEPPLAVWGLKGLSGRKG